MRTSQSQRRTDRRPLVVPSATVLALGALAAVIIALVVLSSVARRANEREVRDERSRVIGAVDRQRQRTLDDLVGLSAAGPQPVRLGSLAEALRIDAGAAGTAVRLGAESSGPVDVDPRFHELAKVVAAAGSDRASVMLAIGGDLVDAAALRQDPARPTAILLGFRPVEKTYLAAVAQTADVQGLQLARLADDREQGGVAARDDWDGFGLTWQPARPGDALMLRWTAVLVALTTGVAVLIIWRARHFAGQLQSSEARAVAASHHDWLSGLPHRMFFNHMLERELQAAKSRGAKLALFYIDMDHFGAINDAFGMETGDRLIQAVTERIAGVVPEARLAARFEGDSFMIMLPGVDGNPDCERLGLALQTAMKPPFDLDGTRVSASASIGVALAPDDATERNEMIRLANLALHRAKREGRNRLAFYRPELDAEWRRRTTAERELRAAIADQGLALRFQPIVSAESGALVCVEALVRWEHPTEGLIAPDRFIGLAEDRGLILPLGEWVLREACRAAVEWPGLRVAVNVSPIQFRQRDFVATVEAILDESGLDPSQLELELTEGILVEYDAASLAAMADLRRRGIRLALDDFGTGYSSLIYLRRFAVDKIKIDRAFIEAVEPGTEGAILVDSVVKLGRALGLTVTAEGVETETQRQFLTDVGCHQLQGYLISTPLAAADIPEFRLRHRPSEQADGECVPARPAAVA